MLKQLHDESNPKEARLSLGYADIEVVVFIITFIAGYLQLKLTSGSMFGSTKVYPH